MSPSAEPPSEIGRLRAKITERPWRAVAGAFAVGAYIATIQPRLPRSRIARDALAIVGALMVRAGREVAARTFFTTVRQWMVAPAE